MVAALKDRESVTRGMMHLLHILASATRSPRKLQMSILQQVSGCHALLRHHSPVRSLVICRPLLSIKPANPGNNLVCND